MSPIFVFGLLGLGAWALARKTPTGASNTAASEVPTDANSMLATVLAPSLIDLNVLRQYYAAFMTSAENQEDSGKSPAAARLAQYALATFLKAAMLTKGAQPEPNELLMIAYAPTAGGQGLIGYGDIGVDVQASVATALNPNYKDMNGIGMYIGALAQKYNTTSPGAARKRLLAFILALKTKQIALVNAPKFPQADQLDAPMYFAIANLPAASLPTVTSPNSILAY